MKRVCTMVVITVLSSMFSVQAADNMKAFPLAEKGMVRHVVQLSKQDE
jgi:serine protease inhibitor ecotin